MFIAIKNQCAISRMENPGLLPLQWQQHRQTLTSALDLLWQRQELVDVTLAAEGGRSIQVHRVVLCACSEYFQVCAIIQSRHVYA